MRRTISFISLSSFWISKPYFALICLGDLRSVYTYKFPLHKRENSVRQLNKTLSQQKHPRIETEAPVYVVTLYFSVPQTNRVTPHRLRAKRCTLRNNTILCPNKVGTMRKWWPSNRWLIYASCYAGRYYIRTTLACAGVPLPFPPPYD